MTTQTKPDRKPVVLWVDDDLSLLMLADKALNKSGFECVGAVSGEEAISLVSRIEPDIILMDVEMPGMDGIETCKTLRKKNQNSNIPVLMVTGHDDLVSINQSYETGATDILIKPINWQLLIYRIQYVIQTSRSNYDLSINKSRLRNVHKIARN